LQVVVVGELASHGPIEDQRFEQPDPPGEAIATVHAAGRSPVASTVPHRGKGQHLPELFVGFIGAATSWTEPAHETLRDDSDQGRSQQVARHPELEQTSHRFKGAVGVNCRQHQVASNRGANGDRRTLFIADLAEQDHVGVLAQHGPQGGGEVKPYCPSHRDLDNVGYRILNRVLERDDVTSDSIDLAQKGIQRCGLAGSGWTGSQDHSLRLLDKRGDPRLAASVETELEEIERTTAARQQANDDLLSMLGRQRRDAEIHGAVAMFSARTPVLWAASLGYVHAGHDFQPGDQARMQPRGQGLQIV